MKIFRFLDTIRKGVKEVCHRFPIPIIFSIAGTTIGILFIHNIDDNPLSNILWTLFLGFPLFISATLYAEKKNWQSEKKSIIYALCGAFLIGYYLLLPENIMDTGIQYIFRSILWITGFILLITFIPFLEKSNKKIQNFWNFNRSLFTNLIQSAFFAGVLFAGLAGALAAIDALFEINIDGERYGEIWMVCAGIIATWYFLHEIPKKPDQEKTLDYGKLLIILTQYILIPLVILYFLILYTYTGQIVLTSQWPKGIVASMILIFSLVGIGTHFFIYPRTQIIQWLKIYTKIFYSILIPQVIVLFIATWMRIDQYGITEKRYLLVLFGVWLLGTALYFLFSKKKDIRWISITLFFITFFSSFGPWGAFAVSEQSQFNRLENLLTQNNLLLNQKIQKATDPEKISFEDRKEISATIRYLHRNHSLQKIQPWFDQDLQKLGEQKDNNGNIYTNKYDIPEKVVELMNLEYLNEWEARNREEGLYLNLHSPYNQVIQTTGYDYITEIHTYYPHKEKEEWIEIEGKQYQIYIDAKKQQIILNTPQSILSKWSLTPFIKDILKTHPKDQYKQEIPKEKQKLEFENDIIKIKLIINHINGSREQENQSFTLDSIGGKILFTLKKNEALNKSQD